MKGSYPVDLITIRNNACVEGFISCLIDQELTFDLGNPESITLFRNKIKELSKQFVNIWDKPHSEGWYFGHGLHEAMKQYPVTFRYIMSDFDNEFVWEDSDMDDLYYWIMHRFEQEKIFI